MALTLKKKQKRRSTLSGNDHDEVKTSSSSYVSLLIELSEETPTLYDVAKSHPDRNATIETHPHTTDRNAKVTPELLQKYQSMADRIYQQELQLFQRKNNKRGGGDDNEDRWVESTVSKGTLKDRIAAMSILVSNHPVHKLSELDGLLSLLSSNARVAQAAEALQDLFLHTLLPSDRKLVPLERRPLYNYEKKTLSPRILLLWRVEDIIRTKFQQFVDQYIAKTLQNGMEFDKIKALRVAASLLRSVPEQESTLLSLIVNKFGDLSNKVPGAAAYEMRRVLRVHSAMQPIVAREVQQLAHRPNLSAMALYNCITFLNQLALTRDDLPGKLVKTYFRLFEVAMKQDQTDGMETRLMSALLTGIKRAYPYLASSDKSLDSHVDALYRVVHSSAPSASTQALFLLLETVGNDADSQPAGRFYRALYATLAHPEHVGAGKHLTMYFNLLYKAMKNDIDQVRIVAMCKRLLSTALHCTPPVQAAALFLVSELSKYHPILLSSGQESLDGSGREQVLDSTKRDPRHALVSRPTSDATGTRPLEACFWELSLLKQHYHPSVTLFAVSQGEIRYIGDPLKDFGIGPCLDKFAYRNPKSADRVAAKFDRGQCVAERKSGRERRVEAQFSPPVNDPSFLVSTNVSAQDAFFHRFFVERARRDKIKGIVRSKAKDTDDEVFDAAERLDVDCRFEDFEQEWETDSEEEAFVDSLAEQIIEDALDIHGLVDEGDDPVIEGWDDPESDGDSSSEGLPDTNGGSGDADVEGPDEAEFLVVNAEADSEDDDDAFMQNSSDSSRSEAPDPPLSDGREDLYHGNDNDLVFLNDASDDDDDLHAPSKSARASPFVSAEEDDEVMNRSWNELKRSNPDRDRADQGAGTSKHKKRRKRNTTHRKKS